MPDQGIFGSDQSQPPNDSNSQQNSGDATKESLAILVGEGRKYKSVEDLAKAYLAADGFIEKLKEENGQLRTVAEKAKTIDEVLERISAKQPPKPDDTPKKAPEGMSAEHVAQIVRDQLTGMETERTRVSNMVKSDELMKQLFGDKAKEVFDREANTPELRKTLMALAATSPEKFVTLFKEETSSKGSQMDSKSSVNTGALDGSAASGRAADSGTKEFYDTLRRKDPKKYYSSAIQLQMNNAAVANPNKFFGRKA